MAQQGSASADREMLSAEDVKPLGTDLSSVSSFVCERGRT